MRCLIFRSSYWQKAIKHGVTAGRQYICAWTPYQDEKHSQCICDSSSQNIKTIYSDYRPIALMPVIMNCFERLVARQLPCTLDTHQFAYHANRSTEGVITIVLHTALSHLEHKGNYVRMLFIDYSSAFNTNTRTLWLKNFPNLGFPNTSAGRCKASSQTTHNPSNLASISPPL